MFSLHPQLAQDTIALGRFELCRLLLMNDSSYPWFVLVPEREHIREIHELNDGDRRQMWGESAQLSRALMECSNRTNSISRRSETRCRNCTCTTSCATHMIPPGPIRCGAFARGSRAALDSPPPGKPTDQATLL